ncbi:hypothetical protein, partial [Mycolicibacterium pallens]
MSELTTGLRVGAAAFVLGLSVAGPAGLAAADTGNANPGAPRTSAADSATALKPTAGTARSRAAHRSRVTGARKPVAPRSARLAPSPVATPVSGVGSSRRVPVGAVVSGVSVGDGGCAGCWG